MKNIKYLVLTFILLLASCSTLPKWYSNQGDDIDYYYGYGQSGQSSSITLNTKAAESRARQGVGATLQTAMKSKLKDLLASVGVENPEEVAEQYYGSVSAVDFILPPSPVDQYAEKDGIVYVRVKVSKKELIENTLNALKDNEDAANKVNFDSAFDDLMQ